jgi:hypothetical protein
MAGRLRILSASRKLSKQGFTPADGWNRLAEFRHLLPLIPPTGDNLARAKEFHLVRGAFPLGAPSFSRRVSKPASKSSYRED